VVAVKPNVPRWVRVVTVLAVLVVALVAAVVSYEHMRALGERAGEGRLAAALPL
jgi:TRAP-type C4-dicarboxylate transport system permease small subunit